MLSFWVQRRSKLLINLLGHIGILFLILIFAAGHAAMSYSQAKRPKSIEYLQSLLKQFEDHHAVRFDFRLHRFLRPFDESNEPPPDRERSLLSVISLIMIGRLLYLLFENAGSNEVLASLLILFTLKAVEVYYNWSKGLKASTGNDLNLVLFIGCVVAAVM
jgi:hypothetical protein